MALLPCTGNAAPAESVSAAVARLFGEQGLTIRAEAQGDLDDDGVIDAALVLTGLGTEGQRNERLVVLAGTADGTYELLSSSGQYCEVRNFCNLEVRGDSLFVAGVHSIGDPVTSTTLQFRYDARLGDLQLIGEEYVEDGQRVDDVYRVSVNHLTGKAIHSRHNAAGRREVARELAVMRRPLNGFVCSSSTYAPSLYIGEDLGVAE